MGITEKISVFVANRTAADFPAEAVELAKMAIMDTIGATVAGLEEDGTKILAEYIREIGGAPTCRIAGFGFMTSAPLSALLMGTMAHALDYDDVSFSMRGHPSAVLVPVILALGDELNITGKKAIEAYIAGFETLAYTGLFLGRGSYVKGWHHTLTIGVVGAAATAAKILDLTEQETRAALGIASSMIGGLRQNFGTMTKPMHAGLAAHNGITAALLAQKGYTADLNILEAPLGLKKAIVDDATISDIPEDVLIKKLERNELDILATGIAFKKYPVCYLSHPAIDAVIELANQEDIKPEAVKAVNVEVKDFVYQGLFYHMPVTPLQAKFSMEFSVAMSLLERRVGLSQFAEEKIKAVAPLMSKVNVTIKKEDSRLGIHQNTQSIEIHLNDGTILKKEAHIPRGHPDNPISWKELEEKFCDCLLPYYADWDIKACLAKLADLENIRHLQEITALLAREDN